MSSDRSDAIIGQDTLLDLVNNSTLDSFPQSLLLIGDQGCGKHSLCKLAAEHLGLELVELDNRMTEEKVLEIQASAFPRMYFIDTADTLPKVQNTILKLVEEPSPGVYIIILSAGISNLLPTLQNRCVKWYFNSYAEDVLQKFIAPEVPYRELILSVATTPGQVIDYQQQDIDRVAGLVNNVVSKIQAASLSNVLNIGEKITFKREPGKIDITLFLKMLKLRLLDSIEESNELKYVKMHQETCQLVDRLQFCIVKPRVFDNFLVRLWESAAV